jgi:hypothetical protein
VVALRRERAIPLGWFAEFAPHGSLAIVWDGCNDPRGMLRLSAHLADDSMLALVGCAIARTTLRRLPLWARGPADAIAVVEEWAEGRAPHFEYVYALNAVNEPRFRLDDIGSHDARSALGAAWYAVQSAQKYPRTQRGAFLAATAASAAEAVADGASDVGAARAEHLAALARLVRECLACPTLDAIRRAFSG